MKHNRTYVYQEKEIHNHFNDTLVIPQRAVRDILGPILVFYDNKENLTFNMQINFQLVFGTFRDLA